MIKGWSLARKLICMSLVIGFFIPALGAFSYYSSKKVAAINASITTVRLPKTKHLGELVFQFRDIRIQARTIPVQGLSNEQVDKYIDLTKKAVAEFIEAKKSYARQLSSQQERELFQEFEASANAFLGFGTELVTLASTHDPANLAEVARMVRDDCPTKAGVVEHAISALIEQQSIEAKSLVAQAHDMENQATWATAVAAFFGFLLAASLGAIVSGSISKELRALADSLAASSDHVNQAANQVSADGASISAASEKQASALQQTVSAIEEINSTIAKSSENADRSQESASVSVSVAQSGRDMVADLIQEVEGIQASTVGLVDAVNESNQEIKRIVDVISEIESKTQVINDIVFQTRLLSFNASVEAARAGEAGKGFAVVAEEVGNLATLSGRSAKEISELLSNSVQLVQGIVTSTKTRTEQQAHESKRRVDRGIEIGNRCAESLTEILQGVEGVNTMVSEIANACREQSVGVSEVSKAMQQMDQVTQQNAKVSHSSAEAADQLNQQAQQMQSLVERLYRTVRGVKASQNEPAAHQRRSFDSDQQINRNAA